MPTFRQSTLALLVLFSLPAGATHYEVIYDGGPLPASISGRLNDDVFLGDVDPIFHRPGEDSEPSCSASGQENNNYRYETIAVTNVGGSDVDVELEIDTGLCDNNHDSIVFAYSPSFDPNDPNTNCLVMNDDFHNRCSLVSTPIGPSETITFVVTNYSPGQLWSWTARFNDRLYEDDFECLSEDDFNCNGQSQP